MKTSTDKELHAQIAAHLNFSEHQGLSVGIYDHGSTHFYGYGSTQPNVQGLPSCTSVYDIGGISKIFAATLIRLFIKEGKVRADDRVGKYLTGLKPPIAALKISDLLDPARAFVVPQIATNPDLGYALLGKIIEQRTDRTYEAVLQKKILLPLSLTHTVLDPADIIVGNRTAGSNQNGVAEYIGVTELAPAVAIKSNVQDLMTYMKILFTTQEAGTSSISREVSLPIQGIELGPEWFQNEHAGTVYFQHGTTPGYSSFLAFDKKKKKAVVLLSNKSSQNLIPLGLKLIEK